MGPTSPKTPILWAWIMNMHFKPNMRKIPIDIFSDLCIRLRWNLTSSCSQQQRLRGWSRMVVKQFQDGGRPPFWKLIYRHISLKIIRFRWILYTAADFELNERHVIKNEKVALDRLRVRQNVFLVFVKKLLWALGARVLLAPPLGSAPLFLSIKWLRDLFLVTLYVLSMLKYLPGSVCWQSTGTDSQQTVGRRQRLPLHLRSHAGQTLQGSSTKFTSLPPSSVYSN